MVIDITKKEIFLYLKQIIEFCWIKDTLESPPAENQSMKKASLVSILITTFFYICCGCFGYASFGDATPGNLLTGFGFYEPYWLVDIANVCIMVHLVGGYQVLLLPIRIPISVFPRVQLTKQFYCHCFLVLTFTNTFASFAWFCQQIYSQPIYSTADRWYTRKFPKSSFVNDFHVVKLPLVPAFEINLFRFCFRTAFVISTVGFAILFPYFNSVLGLLGAINFWPLAIYFPVEMYFVQNKIGAWTRRWIVLRIYSFACFLVTIVGFVGSFEGIVREKIR